MLVSTKVEINNEHPLELQTYRYGPKHAKSAIGRVSSTLMTMQMPLPTLLTMIVTCVRTSRTQSCEKLAGKVYKLARQKEVIQSLHYRQRSVGHIMIHLELLVRCIARIRTGNDFLIGKSFISQRSRRQQHFHPQPPAPFMRPKET